MSPLTPSRDSYRGHEIVLVAKQGPKGRGWICAATIVSAVPDATHPDGYRTVEAELAWAGRRPCDTANDARRVMLWAARAHIDRQG